MTEKKTCLGLWKEDYDKLEKELLITKSNLNGEDNAFEELNDKYTVLEYKYDKLKEENEKNKQFLKNSMAKLDVNHEYIPKEKVRKVLDELIRTFEINRCYTIGRGEENIMNDLYNLKKQLLSSETSFQRDSVGEK